MVDPFTAVAAGMAAVQGIASLFGGAKADKAAKKAAKAQAAAEFRLTQEKLRSLKVEERVLRGQTIAGAAGSGVSVQTGSPLEILAEQAREFQRERMITAQTGATRAAGIKTRGAMVGQQALYGGISAGLGGLSSAFSLYSAGQTPKPPSPYGPPQ
jgi:hypothetical protein